MTFSTLAPGQLAKNSSIAVIGAGPVGAGLTKALIHEQWFGKIKVFEKRKNFGGLWNYTKPVFKKLNVTSCPAIPCETPHGKNEPYVSQENGVLFQTATYKYLDTNVPKFLMEYEKFPFPAGTPLFPLREQVLDYIVDYSKDVGHLTAFNHEVITLGHNDLSKKYQVSTRNLVTNEVETEEFDAVAIACGFYDLPYVPDRPGLKEWHEKFPSSVSHAKDFDCPEDYEGVKGEILVIGNSASGSDLAFELATHLKRTIYKSKRSESLMPVGFDHRISDVSDVLKFDPNTKTVHFVKGERVENVDKIIFCTGYLKSLPFLPKSSQSNSKGNSTLASLVTNGKRVNNLFNHILPYNLPTLGIIGLPKYVLPTRLSETQGAWLARVWSGRIKLPSMKTMLFYDKWFLDLNGDNGTYHDLKFPMDVQYSQRLNREIRDAGSDGYFGVEWTSDQIKIRSSIQPLKEGYLAYFKEKGKRAMNIDELIEEGYFQWPQDALTSVEVPETVP
ncbi:LAME_0D11254g1_1 [Lachancea meyersii CBS 8951]|uniref:LAME_0D11254g1_1 n=1 Tax=Lachancea meyersii CBS 8951 TaxID=1266667 RepID=A0A1G4JCB0_9SACH|nr:LAME_0D11254g1_1 [Lachancea meyersii CBS 8951]